MDHLELIVGQLTVKQLQKMLTKAGVDLRGKYKEEKPYFIREYI